MGLLQKRSERTDEILQGKFIRNKLKETGDDIQRIQRKVTSGFKSEFWNTATFTVADTTLVHQHNKRQRFLDMRTRADKNGNKKKKKSRIIHNKVIYGQYNYLIRELVFGYTEAVKEEVRNLQD